MCLKLTQASTISTGPLFRRLFVAIGPVTRNYYWPVRATNCFFSLIMSGLHNKLLKPLAQGASRFESYWPEKKVTGPKKLLTYILKTNIGDYIQNMILKEEKKKKKNFVARRASNNCMSLARTGPTATNRRRASAYCGGLHVLYVGPYVDF